MTLAIAERSGASWARRRRPSGWPSWGGPRGLPLFDSLAVLGRDETRAAPGRGAGPAARAASLMLLRPAPLGAAHRGLLLAAAIVLYFAVTLVQVWLTSRQYDPHPAGAILVMGAAQYNGVPSPDLQARLDEALTLYHQGYAHLIMVTGSKEPGDVYTEARVGCDVPREQGRAGRRHPRRAATTATRTSPTRRPQLAAHGVTDGAGDDRPVPRGPLHGDRVDARR